MKLKTIQLNLKSENLQTECVTVDVEAEQHLQSVTHRMSSECSHLCFYAVIHVKIGPKHKNLLQWLH